MQNTKKLPALLLREVFASVVKQASGKIIYSKAAETSQYNIKQAIDMLIMSGLVIPVVSSSANGIRTSLENFIQYDNIRVYPLYAIGNIKTENDMTY